MQIKTASWFTKLPSDHAPVGISRGVPRGMAAGCKRFRALEPGTWFKSVTVPDYLQRYNEILARLDAQTVAESLCSLVPDRVPVMLCYESPRSIAEGKFWCHRHLAAQWLEDKLRITVEEVGHRTLDRFAALRMAGIKAPRFI